VVLAARALAVLALDVCGTAVAPMDNPPVDGAPAG
jgi:hypothetical protein